MSQQTDFIKKHSKAIIVATQNTNLFPSVKMAQAILETGFGASTIGNANNLYGIKAVGKHTKYWKGAYVEANTREVINGSSIYINAKFRKYNTLTDSIRDHSELLTSLDRYKPVLAAKTPEQQAIELQKCGYATGVNYANSLINIINKYNLKKLDKKKETMKTVRIIVASLIILAVGYYIYTVIKY